MTYKALPATSRARADSGAAESAIGKASAASNNSVRTIMSIPADVER
jgi:hypothetical protein